MSQPQTKALAVAQSRNINPLIPQSTDDITRIAQYMARAGAVPKSYGTGDEAALKASIAIMKGLEIGWLPMQAVQNMYVVNGIPTIYGDGAVALVRASGELEYMKERIDGDGDMATAVCEVKRRGEAAPVTRTFSKKQAFTAGLLGKQGPWKQYPERMLQMRARAFALRDIFADVLLGMKIYEEAADHAEPEAPTALKADVFAADEPAATTEPERSAPEAQDVECEDVKDEPVATEETDQAEATEESAEPSEEAEAEPEEQDEAEETPPPNGQDIKDAIEAFETHARRSSTFDLLDGARGLFEIAIDGGDPALLFEARKQADKVQSTARARIRAKNKSAAA